jgi:glycerophosphoryl diester phosphodiesterase
MSAPDRVEVHGHRGARAVFPENTLAGYLHAIEAGADFIELDVLATADDALVACHDPVLRRRIYSGPFGTRVVRRMTLAQLKAWDCGERRNPLFRRQSSVPGARIPALAEVFDLAPLGGFKFNIEVKTAPKRPHLTASPERYAELLTALVRERGLEGRVLVQSFDFRVLGCVRAFAPEIPTAALCGLRVRDFAALAAEAGVSTVVPYHRAVNSRRIAEAHDAGIRVIAWTANRAREWDRLVRAGVDGIITDDPAGLLAHLGR